LDFTVFATPPTINTARPPGFIDASALILIA
jgi:hypothetical protein